MSYFCYYDVSEIIVPMLLMELSTVHLNLVRAEFLNSTGIVINMGFFVIIFFVVRLAVAPYFWWGIYTTSRDNATNPISQQCLPWHFQYVSFVFGMFFNFLNAFWAYRIILKLKRKFAGKESIKHGNQLKNR